MTIKKIQITNIKGIEAKSFELDILANRPSLLVAPNGFGKSSFAAAFLSLLQNKISVHEDHQHKSDADLEPKLNIEYEDADGHIHSLEADGGKNEIKEHFSWFVINNQIKAKGVGRNFGGHNVVSASISVDPVVLIDTIPEKKNFGYSNAQQKKEFGKNGKVLPDISKYLENSTFVRAIGEKYGQMDRVGQVRNQQKINGVIAAINLQQGSADQLRCWFHANKLGDFEQIAPLKEVADLIMDSNLGVTDRYIAFLAVLQLHKLYCYDKAKFRQAQKYVCYEFEKLEYTQMLAAFNTSWCRIAPREDRRKLIVEFPKAKHISNGQRDVITFVALLYRAQNKLNGQNSILVIDEVFDYLDDANLVAVQYYITKMIDKYKTEGRRLYPLILTHLNPYYFKNFVFSKQKVYFLDRRKIQSKPSLVKLLKNRENASIQDDVSKHLLHYHPSNINKRAEFEALNLSATWGEGKNFNLFITEECRKYINEEEGFDPLAICCAVRIKAEEYAYQQLLDQAHRDAFITTFKTREKLSFAEGVGALVPEYFYLLGVIYNEGMHWQEGQDNISPVAAKLENNTIKALITLVIQA